jgi:hypothetical protein
MTDEPARRETRRLWPWAVLALMACPAIWHFVDFPDDIDSEYPDVLRPTFSARPPSAYRLAEPGDTIDRVALYASSVVVALAAAGWIATRRATLWPAAIAVGLAAVWFSVTPWPCYDGWHGLGWQAIGDPSAPPILRIGLAFAALFLAVIAAVAIAKAGVVESWREARERGIAGLLAAAAGLMAFRAFDVPGAAIPGYWPRWGFSLGLVAFGLAIFRAFPRLTIARRARISLGTLAASLAIIAIGLRVTWLHRPLERLHAVVPGKIYISAMPSYRGLEVEYARLPFKTIINLFPEESLKDKLSTRLPDELRFAREHGIRYVGSPGTAIESDTFLDETLALAQDPSAWPILVHCHGCMDRSPAWMGIYRFVVQGRPLDEVMREIEAHRGWRPKASVTLLYNRVLPPRAPSHYAGDPTARVLKDAARGTIDPYDEAMKRTAVANPEGAGGVPRR